MKLLLRMQCDNAAFDIPESEIARILREAATAVEQEGVHRQAYWLRDANGNNVGEMVITEDTRKWQAELCR